MAADFSISVVDILEDWYAILMLQVNVQDLTLKPRTTGVLRDEYARDSLTIMIQAMMVVLQIRGIYAAPDQS
jgi:hypothetical protein